MPFDGVGENDQYVVALDAATGETLWRYDRELPPGTIPDKRKAYGTPVLAEIRGRMVVVTTGADATVGLDPATGKQLWRVAHGGMNSGSVPQLLRVSKFNLANHAEPVLGGPNPQHLQAVNLDFQCPILVTTGNAPTSIVMLWSGFTVKMGSGGAVSFPPSVLWSSNRSAPKRTSPLMVPSAHALTVDDDGIAALINLGTTKREEGGDVDARVRLGDSYWSSPVLAGSTIFTFGKEGAATAMETADEVDGPASLEIADRQELDEGVWATPALAGGGLVLRTEHTLRFYHPDGTNE